MFWLVTSWQPVSHDNYSQDSPQVIHPIMLQEVVMGNPLSCVWSICVCLFPMKSLSVLAKWSFALLQKCTQTLALTWEMKWKFTWVRIHSLRFNNFQAEVMPWQTPEFLEPSLIGILAGRSRHMWFFLQMRPAILAGLRPSSHWRSL